jgi:alkyldihydroxyacetonephosphate synthase
VSEDLEAELVAAIGAEHVLAQPDAGAGPTWRVSPGSAAEVSEVVRRAAAARAAIYPVGAGARRTGDPLNVRARVLISTHRLDQVLQLDETSLLVHVQAGLPGLALEKILVARGLTLGDYPPAVLTSSIGGILAVRTPGKSSARHGFFEDAVVGVSAVLADGRSVHTRIAPRRSTGPDLARALCGSEGTIGLLTSAVLRVHTKPEARLVAAYTLPSVDHAINAIYLALREECAPSGVRIYDAPEAALHFDGLVIPAGTALLVAATAGPTDLAACDRDLLTSAVIAEGGTVTSTALAELWWRRTHGTEPTPGGTPNLQVMARPSKLRTVYRAAVELMAARGGRARAHISRFDADGAVVFVTLEPAEHRAEVERAVEVAGGWLLGARAVKLDAYLHSLRDALDPHQVMNPGVLA